jgi:uracil-DNA glycosylase
MASIVFVGEAFGEHEERKGEPFVGPSGSVLRGLLAQAGIPRESVAFTNVFNFRPQGNQIDSLCTSDRKKGVPNYSYLSRGKYIRAEYAKHIAYLYAFLEKEKPNVVVALGNTPLWALTKKTGIAKWRGSPLLDHTEEWKILPTWHPAAILRQWELRPIAFMDLLKAKRESATPLLSRPKRFIHLEPTLADLDTFYTQYIEPAPFVVSDIETKGDSITEVGFAPSASRAIVVPFWHRVRHNYWQTQEEERAAWEWVRKVFANKRTVGQNFSYDMQYLYRKMGITTPRFFGDTMLLHHSLQPEMKKSLAFLGSIYTDEPSWKFMRTDHSTMKREDE